MDDPDAELAALNAASDQLATVARTYATQLIGFYRALVDAGLPVSLAARMTLNHQAHLYGWDDAE